MRGTLILFSACIFTLGASCQADQKQDVVQSVKPKTQAEIDDELIKKYLKDNSLQAESTTSGIYYIIEKEGEGAHPTVSSKVKVHYHGTMLDGQIFDSSVDRGEPISFGLGQVIKGWQEGIPLLKKGGKGKLIIPSGLAYGPSARSNIIKANSVLIFDVELLDF